jgi:hypothetical protein
MTGAIDALDSGRRNLRQCFDTFGILALYYKSRIKRNSITRIKSLQLVNVCWTNKILPCYP